jgi:hypothetical protein
MFVAGKKDDELVFVQGKTLFILGNVEGPLHADDDHKGIEVPPFMDKVFLVKKLAGGNMDEGIGVLADQVLHGDIIQQLIRFPEKGSRKLPPILQFYRLCALIFTLIIKLTPDFLWNFTALQP